MKKLIKTLGYCLTIAISLNSCASMFGDHSRQIAVSSSPEGADIYLNGERFGTTPAILTLPNYLYTNNTMMLRKQGYQDQTAGIGTQFQAVSVLNIFFLPGFLIDFATGDIMKLNPNTRNLQVQLNRTPNNPKETDTKS